MSFTKLTYDDCSYKANLAGNVSQMSYIFDDSRYYNCNKCRPENGIVGGTAVSHISGNLVDLESTLIGIDREASRCATMKYLPRDDNIAMGSDYYHKRPTNKVETGMKHLQACQMHDVKGIPHPSPMDSFKCSR